MDYLLYLDEEYRENKLKSIKNYNTQLNRQTGDKTPVQLSEYGGLGIEWITI